LIADTRVASAAMAKFSGLSPEKEVPGRNVMLGKAFAAEPALVPEGRYLSGVNAADDSLVRRCSQPPRLRGRAMISES
jgi:hypothetical protein